MRLNHVRLKINLVGKNNKLEINARLYHASIVRLAEMLFKGIVVIKVLRFGRVDTRANVTFLVVHFQMLKELIIGIVAHIAEIAPGMTLEAMAITLALVFTELTRIVKRELNGELVLMARTQITETQVMCIMNVILKLLPITGHDSTPLFGAVELKQAQHLILGLTAVKRHTKASMGENDIFWSKVLILFVKVTRENNVGPVCTALRTMLVLHETTDPERTLVTRDVVARENGADGDLISTDEAVLGILIVLRFVIRLLGGGRFGRLGRWLI